MCCSRMSLTSHFYVYRAQDLKKIMLRQIKLLNFMKMVPMQITLMSMNTYVLVRRTNLAPPVQQPHRSSSSPVVQPNTSPAASFMQHHHSSPIPTTTVVHPPQSSPIPTDPAVQSPQCSPDGASPSRNGDANHISHDDLVMFSSLFNFFSSSPIVIF